MFIIIVKFDLSYDIKIPRWIGRRFYEIVMHPSSKTMQPATILMSMCLCSVNAALVETAGAPVLWIARYNILTHPCSLTRLSHLFSIHMLQIHECLQISLPNTSNKLITTSWSIIYFPLYRLWPLKNHFFRKILPSLVKFRTEGRKMKNTKMFLGNFFCHWYFFLWKILLFYLHLKLGVFSG